MMVIYERTPSLSLPLAGGGKSKRRIQRFASMQERVVAAHLPLKGGEPAPDLIRGRSRSDQEGVYS